MNWLRRLLGLHVHQWGPIITVTIMPATYVAVDDPNLTINFLGRTIHVRHCDCGADRQVYPRRSN